MVRYSPLTPLFLALKRKNPVTFIPHLASELSPGFRHFSRLSPRAPSHLLKNMFASLCYKTTLTSKEALEVCEVHSLVALSLYLCLQILTLPL